jgi:hypothetical protein
MMKCVFAEVLFFCVSFSALCHAAEVLPGPPHCAMLQSTAVTQLDQRIVIADRGFSVLPPQGERWCYRLLTSAGVSFFRIPPLAGFEKPPSLEEIVVMRLFSGMAMSLKGFKDLKSQIETYDELKAVVNLLIREQLFSQITVGVATVNHRFHLLESNVSTVAYSDMMCVKFDAKVEELGNLQAPNLVFVLHFPGNVVCRHPLVSDTELIWVGFTERYLRSEQPTADTLKREYEPYIQSLQFIEPR